MAFFAFIFGLLVVFKELLSIYKSHTIRIINVFGVVYGCIYGLLLSFYYSYYEQHPAVNLNYLKLFDWFILAVLSYIVLQLSYYTTKGNKVHSKPITNHLTNTTEVLKLALLLTFIGAVSILLWCQAYGGIVEAIIKAPMIRAGYDTTANRFSVLIRFGPLTLLSTILLVRIIKETSGSFGKYISLIISLASSLLYLLLNDGRFTTAVFFLVLLLAALNILEPRKIRFRDLSFLLAASIAGLVLISQLDALTDFVRLGEFENSDTTGASNFITKEFFYIYLSGTHVLSLPNGSPWLILKDIESGIFSIFPSSLKPSGYLPLWQYNSISISGKGYDAETPTDFITSAIYDLSYLGPLFFGLIWGKIIHYVDSIQRSNNTVNNAVYYYLVYIFIRIVAYYQLADIAQCLFPILVCYLLKLFFVKQKNNNSGNKIFVRSL